MRKDIFSPSFGNRPSRLVGREEIVNAFIEGLKGRPGNRERASLILGQRGAGKTALLLELRDRAKEMGFVTTPPIVTAPGMTDRIIEIIENECAKGVKSAGRSIKGGSIGAFGFSMGIQFGDESWQKKSFSYKISELCESLNKQGKGVLILLDEVIPNSGELKQIVISYQEMVGEEKNVAFAMAGLPGAISSVLSDKVLTFLNRANRINLSPLNEVDIDAYYAQTFKEEGIRINRDLRRKAVAATKGMPYMLQLIGYYITSYAGADGAVREEHVSDAIISAREAYIRDVSDTILRALSDTDIRFLRAMITDKTSSKIASISERMQVSDDMAYQYRRRLIDSGVIESVRRGEVRFAVPYIREALEKEGEWS